MARIMVVEDEPITATDLEHKLSALGHEVVGWSDSGEDALAQAKTLAPDLVLMDIRLRGDMSGIDAARQLRQYSQVPVVFLTAFADQDTVDRACETLPYGYLLKPFTERSVVAAVQVALARAREEQAQSARERWLSAGLRSAGEALIAVDERAAIRFMNERAEAMLHVRASDVLGKAAQTIVPLSDEQGGDSTHPLDLALREGRVTSGARRSLLALPGGAPISVSYSAAPVIATGDHQTGAVLILRELPTQETDLTLESNTEVSALSMRLSHEINNPLTYNLGALQLALRELDQLRAMSAINGVPNDPATAQREAQLLRVEQLLRNAQDGATRVANVMRELSSLSLAEEDAAPLHPAELLDLAIGLSGVGAQHVRFERQIEPTPLVRASKWPLARVLAAAVQDAVSALDTRATRPAVLTLRLFSDTRGWAELSITASGPPVSAAASRPELLPAGAVRQTSVGTLVAEQLAARYGGEFTVCERPEGRVLTLRLPPMNVASPEREVQSQNELAQTRGSVLVIDDEPLIGRVLELSLRAEHDVTTVSSAHDGLALLERGDAFDAILCDLMMPGMSGQDFYEQLSATRPDLAQRVILMTGGATNERAQRFVTQMAGRCLLKPLSTHQLLPLLAERVRARSVASPARPVAPVEPPRRAQS